MPAEEILASALGHLEALIAFRTVSSEPNKPLLDYAAEKLGPSGAVLDWVLGDGGKASLVARIGPSVPGGIVLSGHTDVVPVEGQAWTSDPWTLTGPRDGRLYGRGASDMKSFVALSLALAEAVDPATLRRPLLLALSHDEEVGCLGAPALVDAIVERQPLPAAVIVGEPTSMRLVTAHKGVIIFRITVEGHEAHSSLTHLGASAVMEALPLLAAIGALAEELERTADPYSPFKPKGPTLTVGTVNGGTAANILARQCSFVCDLRSPQPGHQYLESIAALVEETDRRLSDRFSGAGARMECLCDVPALQPDPDGAAARLVRSLTGDNSPGLAVAYGAEAGIFQESGLSTVICGPGSIDQAHQPDEYIELSQLGEGAEFMARLGTICCSN